MNAWKLIVFIFSTTALASCAPYGLNNEKAGYCNQMNSQLIFSGATSNTRNADIERAQQPLLQQTYDDRCRPASYKKQS